MTTLNILDFPGTFNQQFAAAGAALAPAGGRLFIPAGLHTYSDTLVWPAANVEIVGEGRSNTILKYTGSEWALLMGNPAYTGAAGGTFETITLADLKLVGTPAAQGAIKVYAASRYTIERVYVYQFAGGYGIGCLDFGWLGEINSCRLQDCFIGLGAKAPPGKESFNGVHVRGGEIIGGQYGVVVGDLGATSISGAGCGKAAVIRDSCIEGCKSGGVWLIEGYAITLDGNYFESNANFNVRLGKAGLGNGPSTTKITNNWFQGSFSAQAVDLVACNDPVIANNHSEQNFLRLTGSVNRAVARDNFVNPQRVYASGEVGRALITRPGALSLPGGVIEQRLAGYFATASYAPGHSGDGLSAAIGTVSYDENYVYVRTATGWKRAALGAW